jgi:hypothetical protein
MTRLPNVPTADDAAVHKYFIWHLISPAASVGPDATITYDAILVAADAQMRPAGELFRQVAGRVLRSCR